MSVLVWKMVAWRFGMPSNDRDSVIHGFSMVSCVTDFLIYNFKEM